MLASQQLITAAPCAAVQLGGPLHAKFFCEVSARLLTGSKSKLMESLVHSWPKVFLASPYIITLLLWLIGTLELRQLYRLWGGCSILSTSSRYRVVVAIGWSGSSFACAPVSVQAGPEAPSTDGASGSALG